jgi:hypothetical protein
MIAIRVPTSAGVYIWSNRQPGTIDTKQPDVVHYALGESRHTIVTSGDGAGGTEFPQHSTLNAELVD